MTVNWWTRFPLAGRPPLRGGVGVSFMRTGSIFTMEKTIARTEEKS